MPLREILASPPGSAPMGTPAVVHPHTILDSMPKWRDVVEMSRKNPEYHAKVKVGYPRFFIHNSVRKLIHLCLEAADVPRGELMAAIFPTSRILLECVSFIRRRRAELDVFRDCSGSDTVRAVHFDIAGQGKPFFDSVHAFLYPPELEQLVREFWINAGMGISSRHAEYILRRLEEGGSLMIVDTPSENRLNKYPGALCEKATIRQKIANLVNGENNDQSMLASPSGKRLVQLEDVFLYPSGMSAIWHAHQLFRTLLPGQKHASFGYLYLDTMRVLKWWGEEFIPYLDADPNTILKELCEDPPKISALYLDFPSNPLLKSPDLRRVRELANLHGFLIVVDETVGNFINSDVIQYADIICTSLSKMFSGSANVLGGSLVVNPNSRLYNSMHTYLEHEFVDDFYSEDAVVMEFNSRDFAERVRTANTNAVAIATFLRSRSISFQKTLNSSNSHCTPPGLAIKDVHFPKWTMRKEYDICRRRSESCLAEDNFGYLLSITFISTDESEAFYDALQCAKGPTIGTNFTLAIPFVMLAHYNERDEVAKYGLDETLVRLSVGIEELDVVMGWVETALEAAENVAKEKGI
ncbi:PLP-dependent transferase [Marasmius fiardii PR-910]|nr:PLP-dependent transferase [Marasmius fiardii PR-910]